MKVYQCRRCRAIIKSNSYPDSRYCSGDKHTKGGDHSWHELGTVGDKNYQCRRCGIIIQTDSYPDSRYCEDQGNSSGYSHNWHEL